MYTLQSYIIYFHSLKVLKSMNKTNWRENMVILLNIDPKSNWLTVYMYISRTTYTVFESLFKKITIFFQSITIPMNIYNQIGREIFTEVLNGFQLPAPAQFVQK